jgi:NitT/TauT family transport system ATP-binding protein
VHADAVDPVPQDHRFTNVVGDTTGTPSAVAPRKCRGLPVTSASAYPACATSRKGRSSASSRSIGSGVADTRSAPRDPRSPEFAALVDHIHDVITSSELPDALVTAGVPAPVEDRIEPLPRARSGDVVALVDHLVANSGSGDLFDIAGQTQTPFDRMVPVVKAAEVFELVDTPRRQVVLTALGRRFAAASPEEQKRIRGAKALSLRLFRVTLDLVAAQGGILPREALIRELANQLPTEDPEATFDTLVAWARVGGLLSYSEATQHLTRAGSELPA